MPSDSFKKSSAGFTLIELIAVIVLLGILAAIALPRFANLSDDASKSVVTSTHSAFKSGIHLVHIQWIAAGSPGDTTDFLPVNSSRVSGSLSLSSAGWPWRISGSGQNHCMDIWESVLDDSSPTVSSAEDTADYQAVPNNATTCTYIYQAKKEYSITYSAVTGETVLSL